jgi:hypothetical protein
VQEDSSFDSTSHAFPPIDLAQRQGYNLYLSRFNFLFPFQQKRSWAFHLGSKVYHDCAVRYLQLLPEQEFRIIWVPHPFGISRYYQCLAGVTSHEGQDTILKRIQVIGDECVRLESAQLRDTLTIQATVDCSLHPPALIHNSDEVWDGWSIWAGISCRTAKRFQCCGTYAIHVPSTYKFYNVSTCSSLQEFPCGRSGGRQPQIIWQLNIWSRDAAGATWVSSSLAPSSASFCPSPDFLLEFCIPGAFELR